MLESSGSNSHVVILDFFIYDNLIDADMQFVLRDNDQITSTPNSSTQNELVLSTYYTEMFQKPKVGFLLDVY